MASGKEVRRRIKSATNTRQIIKAMELVSVVKMQKTVARNQASRAYGGSSEVILASVINDIRPEDHLFLQKRSESKKLIVVITSDRGLCGGLNYKSIKLTLEIAKDAKEAHFITIGRKGRDFLKNYGAKIIAEFTKIDEKLSFKDIMPITKLIVDDFLAEKYSEVVLVYTHFESSLLQTPKVVNLLPFCISGSRREEKIKQDRIVFEPGKEKILDDLIPRMLEIKIWQALLESIASEHSARMVAMKNANENAKELIDDLTLTYNQTRQAGITREIAEISAGKMTLEG